MMQLWAWTPLYRELKHQTFLVPRTPTGSIFAAWQPLRISRRSWASVTDFKTRVLRLKPEVQILGSSKSIRHTKVEILRLKSCFLRMKENLTQIFERHFQLNYSVGVRDGFTLFCLMICIWPFRPQSLSLLGHVVLQRGALEATVTGCQKTSHIRSRMCRSYKYHCSCS